MSTIRAHTDENGIVNITGNLTFNANEMMLELGDRYHFMFGDIKKLIQEKLPTKLSTKDISDLYNNGTTMEFYSDKNIWCYLCVRPSDCANYMFSHIDSENRDNNFIRIREGVKFFYNNNFDIFIVTTS